MDLITGGTGIVGVHLLQACTAAGDRVRALYRKGSDRSIVARVFEHYGNEPEKRLQLIEWAEGDLHDIGSLTDAMDGIDRVYHCAAKVSFAPGDRKELFRVNAGGTANVVNAALIEGVKRLCHVSSTATIGHAPAGIERDETLPWTGDRNTSPYAASKYEAELEVYRGIAEGLDAVIVNPSIVIGPGMPGRSSLTMIERLQNGTRFFPPGSNAVVDARDVADCMRVLMERGGTGERYLIVGHNVSYEQLFTKIAGIFGSREPHIALSPTVLKLAWRLEHLRSIFTGSKPLITRSTVHSSIIQRSFSNAKVKKAIGHEFRSLQDTIANVSDILG